MLSNTCSFYIEKEKKLIMHGSYFYRSVSDRFDISKSMLPDSMRRVVAALNNLAERFIKWPVSDRLNEVKYRFSEIGSLPNVIEAIDGTHILIPAPKINPIIYKRRIYGKY